MRQYVVYILASRRNGTLYIGMTSNMAKRVYEHKRDLVDGFTKRYRVHDLVYYEVYEDIRGAITREKRLKELEEDMEIGIDREIKS